MSLVFHGTVTDLKKSFVAAKLNENTKVAKSLNLVPKNNK